MNIDIIKKRISEYQNTKLKIKVSLGRNKYEYLEGEIYKIYPNIFTIRTNKGIKSISYSEIATKIVEIVKFR